MAFARPTLTELIDRVIADISSRVTGVDSAVLRRSLLGIIGRAEAGAVHMLYGYLDWIARQAIIDTAEKEHLERWASIWGISKRAASFAAGTVTFSGASGSTILDGTIVQRQDGVQYETQGTFTIAGASVGIPVLAVQAGSGGNLPAGAAVTLLSPIAGVQATASVTAAVTGGADTETDARLLARLLARIQAPPHGGALDDYKLWALEVAGVTRVWVYPQQMGAGTVTVMFVCDDSTPIIPTAAKVAEVQAHIDAKSPVTAEVFVVAPVPDPLNMNIKISPNIAAVQAAVQAEIQDLLVRDAEPGNPVLISRLREAVSLATGESDNQIVNPAANVEHAVGHIATPGTFVFSGL